MRWQRTDGTQRAVNECWNRTGADSVSQSPQALAKGAPQKQRQTVVDRKRKDKTTMGEEGKEGRGGGESKYFPKRVALRWVGGKQIQEGNSGLGGGLWAVGECVRVGTSWEVGWHLTEGAQAGIRGRHNQRAEG